MTVTYCDTPKSGKLEDLAYRNIQGIFTVLFPQVTYKTYRVQTYMSEIQFLSGLQDFIHIVTGVEAARLTVLGIRQMSRLDVLKRNRKGHPFFGADMVQCDFTFFFGGRRCFLILFTDSSCLVR